ncbi:hypothetical protein EJ04DRAFT_509219 [Polyplosphaeria fusca]|uniref:Uncharacterized protein n=1 Tax=Polyplosphaeria fusca TaxID=682080 RepID=A0A9P4R9A6_9PLEO|nr:hypothetical protein EJ04DRAFT_509219 [Polyplosphaeria fusca]
MPMSWIQLAPHPCPRNFCCPLEAGRNRFTLQPLYKPPKYNSKHGPGATTVLYRVLCTRYTVPAILPDSQSTASSTDRGQESRARTRVQTSPRCKHSSTPCLGYRPEDVFKWSGQAPCIAFFAAPARTPTLGRTASRNGALQATGPVRLASPVWLVWQGLIATTVATGVWGSKGKKGSKT